MRLVAAPRNAVALGEAGQLLEEAVVGPVKRVGSSVDPGSPKNLKTGGFYA